MLCNQPQEINTYSNSWSSSHLILRHTASSVDKVLSNNLRLNPPTQYSTNCCTFNTFFWLRWNPTKHKTYYVIWNLQNDDSRCWLMDRCSILGRVRLFSRRHNYYTYYAYETGNIFRRVKGPKCVAEYEVPLVLNMNSWTVASSFRAHFHHAVLSIQSRSTIQS